MQTDRDIIAEQIKGGSRFQRHLLNWRLRWLETARPKQLPPPGDWDTWLLLAGRGFGKTRIGAEDAGYFAAKTPGARIAVVAPTQNDCRTVCFEGESGLLDVIPEFFVKSYSATTLELELINGATLFGKSAEKPDRLRGPQFHHAWCDEVASWQRLQDTWDNLLFGLRLGARPRVVATSTPRPIDFIRAHLKNPRTHVTRGSTFENRANLAESALRMFKEVYEGTRKGAQELYGEVLENNENALWKQSQIELLDVDESELPEFTRTVIAIDPAVTTEEQSDETGIIVASLGYDGKIYVREDLSGKYSPAEWARVSLDAYERYDAESIVAEVNQGGDLVEANLKGWAGNGLVNVKKIRAKTAKLLRAEPIAAYYEKGKVRHAGRFPLLEKQMTNYTGSTDKKSPDRLDALVYGVGELMIGTVSHAVW